MRDYILNDLARCIGALGILRSWDQWWFAYTNRDSLGGGVGMSVEEWKWIDSAKMELFQIGMAIKSYITIFLLLLLVKVCQILQMHSSSTRFGVSTQPNHAHSFSLTSMGSFSYFQTRVPHLNGLNWLDQM